jgi:hypothetical protein
MDQWVVIFSTLLAPKIEGSPQDLASNSSAHERSHQFKVLACVYLGLESSYADALQAAVSGTGTDVP